MPAKSPRIFQTLLFTTIISLAAFAQAETYPDLFACEAAFKQQNAPASHDVMHTWCSSRVYSVQFNVDVCVEQKAFAATPSSTTVSSSQRSQFQPACVTQVGSGTSGSTASSGTGSGTPSSGSTALQVNPQTLPACQVQNPTSAQQQQCQQAIAAEQIRLANVAQQQAQQAEQRRREEQAREQQQQQQQQQQNAQMIGALAPALGALGGGGQSSGSGGSAGAAPSQSSSAPVGETPAAVNPAASIANGNAAASSAPMSADDVAAIDPRLEGPARDVANAPSSPDDVNAPPTDEVTGAGRQPGQRIQQSEQTAQQAFNQIQAGEVQFTTWSQGVNKVVQEYRSYKTKHESCVKKAETAKHLCLEGTSPGVKAAKTLVTVAGPLLAAMNAVKKSCGDTGKVMKLAQLGMTAAEGVCVGAKVMCDKTCDQAQKHLENTKTALNALQGQASADEATGRATCLSNHPVTPTPADPDPQLSARENCYGEVTRDKQSAARINNGYQQLQAQLNEPQNGTTNNMIAKCGDLTKDIALMAINAAGLLAASQSAKKCEKELDSGSGSNAGTAMAAAEEYCSAEATRDSQFCKCKSNSSGEGCGPILAAGPPTETPADQRGVNLQNGRGPSAFAGAGGNSGGLNSSGYRGYDLGSDGSGSVQSNLGSISSTLGSGANGGAPGGVAGAAGAGSAPGASGTGDTKKTDDKKWSFGSFASAIGSSLGFGGGSGSRGSDANTRALAAKANVERKIASDRFAAEVSPSTGADNFTKIKRSYTQKVDTFMATP